MLHLFFELVVAVVVVVAIFAQLTPTVKPKVTQPDPTAKFLFLVFRNMTGQMVPLLSLSFSPELTES